MEIIRKGERNKQYTTRVGKFQVSEMKLKIKYEFENLHYRVVGGSCPFKLNHEGYILPEVILPFVKMGWFILTLSLEMLDTC